MDDGRRISGEFPVRTAARMSGLTPDLIRAWERRYAVVKPRRGPRGARLYTSDDVEHLALLGEAVNAGRSISDVASLEPDDLMRLVEDDRAARGAVSFGAAKAAASLEGTAAAIIERVLAAARALSAGEVERELGDGFAALGGERFAREVVPFLLRQVGDLWASGELSIASEHLVSAALRNLLSPLVRPSRHPGGQTVLLAAPAGERHEFGLFLAAFTVLESGGSIVYLGCDVPAEEIARSVQSSGAAAVALSVVAGENRERASGEIERLERMLDADVALWVGGRDAAEVCARGRSRAVIIGELDVLERRVRRLASGLREAQP